MWVGSLGNRNASIVFRVSASQVKTFNNFRWQSSARYAVHNRHLRAPLPELTGRDLDRVTFDIMLSAYLGVNPQTDMSKLYHMMVRGEKVELIIGRSLTVCVKLKVHQKRTKTPASLRV